MSLSFYVAAPNPPRFSAVVDALAEPRLACVEDRPSVDGFPEGFFFHLYLPGSSARGVELGVERGVFQIRLMTCSSRPDHQLGLRLVDTLAAMTRSEVRVEDGDVLSREQVSRRYDSAWVERTVKSGADTVIALVEQERKTVTLSGPRRSFHLGPRFLSELRSLPGEPLWGQLIAAMVALQSVDEDRYYPASVMQVGPKGASPGQGVTVAVWGQGVAYLFPEVEYLVLTTPKGPLFVPADKGPRLAPERWRYLDERHALVEAVPENEWAWVLEQARRLARDPRAR